MPYDPGFDPSVSPLDRLRGLLLGGAVGDALGAPVEFMSRAQILERFGSRGITEFAPAYGRLGAVTDDTQLTLFTLDGLIRARVRQDIKGICHPPSVIDHAYRRWYTTQTGQADPERPVDGWLIEVRDLWSARAPGLTCLEAFRHERPLGEPARNASKGAGGIMRVAPIALAMNDAFRNAREVAALSHGHVTGQVAAGWFAAWIAEAATWPGNFLWDSSRDAWFPIEGLAPELDQALGRAWMIAGKGPADVVPAELGEGWVAEEAAAIALWCVLTTSDPLDAIRLAVNIDGDSDTTGSLVGQFYGAVLGPRWIPQIMLDQLELVDVMEALAHDACKLFWGGIDAETEPGFWDRYPGW